MNKIVLYYNKAKIFEVSLENSQRISFYLTYDCLNDVKTTEVVSKDRFIWLEQLNTKPKTVIRK